MLKKTLLFLALIIVVIQFIRPAKNQSGENRNDISTIYPVPPEVHSVLKSACYDCHSNHTDYPWYDRIQPVAWWLQHHIDEGREELNFSEFALYPPKKRAHKMKEIAGQVQQKEMPLKSYTWMHRDARLSAEEREILINWAKELEQEIR